MNDVEDIYELSPLQRGMLFHALSEPRLGLFVQQAVCTLTGALDVGAFRRAWEGALALFPVLRASVAWKDVRIPHQIVHAHVALPWVEQDWRGPDADPERRFEEFLEADRVRGIDPGVPPLMRCTLVRTGESTYRFAWTHHHLLLDGWSLGLVWAEVLRRYRASLGDRAAAADPAPVRPFREYVVALKAQRRSADEAYWRRYLAGFEAPTGGWDRAPGPRSVPAARHGLEHVALSAGEAAAIRELPRRHRLSAATLVSGSWGLLLSRYSGEQDVVFGRTISVRSAEYASRGGMAGLLVNTLPARVEVEPRANVCTWLRRIQEDAFEQEPHAHAGLADVQRWSEVPPGVPLFHTVAIFDADPLGGRGVQDHAGLRVSDVRVVERLNDPLVVVVGTGDETFVRLAYDRERVDDAWARQLLRHFRSALVRLASDPEARLCDVDLLDGEERRLLCVAWARRDGDYPRGALVHELVAERAERAPEDVAVASGERRITYRELVDRARGLAVRLRALGVRPEQHVGVCLERSIDLVVAMLAVLEAGAAWVPLDPRDPGARRSAVVRDARIEVVLNEARLAGRIQEQVACSVAVDGEQGPGHGADAPVCPAARGTADRLAYTIYTSGSTGAPKGVQVSHRSVVNVLHAMRRETGFTQRDVVLAVTPVSFDISVLEIFLPLVTGARLVMASREESTDAGRLVAVLKESGATVLQATPATWRLLLAAGWEGNPSLKALCGGEALPRSLARDLCARSAAAWNLYGPTETTIWSLADRLGDERTAGAIHGSEDGAEGFASIGRVLDNTEVFVLDEQLEPVPVGVAGEIYLGGDGLARGYLGRPEWTAERFVPSPFGARPGARLYRTGDVARHGLDGRIEYLGRRDQQVKLRGFRIELGEVEAALSAHEAVRQCAVLVAGDDDGSRHLAAYLVPKGPDRPSARALREHARTRLPGHMVPVSFSWVDAFPLTRNGKLDRRALAAEGAPVAESEEAAAAPTDGLEETIAAIWREVLGRSEVERRDSFFDVGGNSLLVLRVHAALRDRVGADLTVTDLFEHPTIADLASLLRKGESRGRRAPATEAAARARIRSAYFERLKGIRGGQE